MKFIIYNTIMNFNYYHPVEERKKTNQIITWPTRVITIFSFSFLIIHANNTLKHPTVRFVNYDFSQDTAICETINRDVDVKKLPKI